MGFLRRGLTLPTLPYTDKKATDKPVSFQVNLIWDDYQPAGIPRKMILANGQHWAAGHTPRPTVPGFSRRPIPPRDSFLCKWQATNHAEDGLYGAIQISFDDSTERRPMEKAESKSIPIMLSDHWNAEMAMVRDAVYPDKYTSVAQSGILGNPCLTDIGCLPPNNLLAQGLWPRNLSANSATVFSGCAPSNGLTEGFYPDATIGHASLDLISAAFVSTITFPLMSTPSDGNTITNGARYSVLVKLDKPRGDYIIRVANTGLNQILYAIALVAYRNGNLVSTPTSNHALLDKSVIVPLAPQDVSQVDVAQTNSSFPLQLEEDSPLLFYPQIGPPHPIPKHSNKFYVLGEGNGKWRFSSVAEAAKHMPESFNLETPQIRDTFCTPPAATGPTWLGLQYHVNPGAFLLHCHIQIHQSGGMALALLDGIDEWPEIPEEDLLTQSEEESELEDAGF
ncbi:multicopper oxidase-domain-containing protein [Aspergillus navahoensis]